MSRSILIGGLTGSGKSTSIGKIPEYNIKGLDPKTTFIVQTISKDLPFRGYKTNYKPLVTEKKGEKLMYVSGNLYSNRDPKKIINVMRLISEQCPTIKTIILDDWQYIMAFEFMKRTNEKGYEKFNEIGSHGFDVLEYTFELRDDIYVIVFTHVDFDERLGREYVRVKTIGKMLQEKVTIEGLYTIVLEATKLIETKGKDAEVTYAFRTKSIYKDDIVKSPIGMFKESYIPNDLGLVIDLMENYYNGVELKVK